MGDNIHRIFLSCLSGSEQTARNIAMTGDFLSCLSGSELANKWLPALQNKADSHFAMQTFFFAAL